MDVIIKSARIVDTSSPFHGKTCDLLIRNGIIEAIGNDLSDDGITVFEAANLHVSTGWFDMHARFCDPGHEYKEDLNSGANSAAQGGFTGVAVSPATTPPVSSKADVEYLVHRSAAHLVDVHPMGTLSADLKGKELSEMYDMHQAGAVAFTDDKHAVEHGGLISRALLYTKNFGGLTVTFPNDTQLSGEGQMNEGPVSTMLGLRGAPNHAEEVHVNRDINLAAYTDSKLHLSMISTSGSVDLVRKAKAAGLAVTAEVAAHSVHLNDTTLESFNSNLKVFPPLRSEQDRQALIEGLKDGTIDVISSDHTPEDIENKDVDFANASFGISSLETAFSSAVMGAGNELSVEQVVEKFTTNPRHILQLEVPTIQEGAKANLTCFDPSMAWTVEENNWTSKSFNTPFAGQTLTGKALAVYNNGQFKTCS